MGEPNKCPECNEVGFYRNGNVNYCIFCEFKEEVEDLITEKVACCVCGSHENLGDFKNVNKEDDNEWKLWCMNCFLKARGRKK
jgi:hypothetical protein